MQTFEPSNTSIHSIDLQALSKMRSDKGPIFSLYLNLREAGTAVHRFQQLLQDTEQKNKLEQADPEQRQQWAQEVEQVRQLLSRQDLSRQAQGLVMFSSLSSDLWQVYFLPVPVIDRLVVKGQPYTRPLENLLGEFSCTLLVLVDEGMARLVKVHLGSVEEVDQVEAVPVTGSMMGDDGQFARYVAERVEGAWQYHECGQLVLGGSTAMQRDLRDALPQWLHERLAGEVHLSPQAGTEEIITQVGIAEAELDRRIEAQRVQHLIASAEKHEGAAMGLEQTLLVVRSGKVRQLLVEEDYHPAGYECPNCGFLSDEDEKQCLLCGMQMRPEPDIVEIVIRRVLDGGGEVDVLRSAESRRALAQYGSIGGLLFDQEHKPLEEEASNQMPLSKGGKIHPDHLHDEAIQESFPGSDPPSF